MKPYVSTFSRKRFLTETNINGNKILLFIVKNHKDLSYKSYKNMGYLGIPLAVTSNYFFLWSLVLYNYVFISVNGFYGCT